MALRPLTAISLCSGVGGLDLGLELALPGLRPVLYVEHDLDAAGILAQRAEEGHLPAAPIWSDVRTLDCPEVGEYLGEALAGGGLDLIYGGIPCQPHSLAGARRGADDPRDLWPATLRFMEALERWGMAPGAVLIENVAGAVSSGLLDRVGSDLSGLGFRCAATLISAEAVGATHGRERLFILGVRGMDDAKREPGRGGELLGRRAGEAEPAELGGRTLDDAAGQRSEQVADAEGQRRGERRPESAARLGGSALAGSGGSLADADGRNDDQEKPGLGRGASASGSGPELADAFGLGRGGRHDEHSDGSGPWPESEAEAPGRCGRLADSLLFAPGKSGHENLWLRAIQEDHGLAPVVLVPRSGRQRRDDVSGSAPESPFRRVAYGLAARLDGRRQRLAQIGNGVVPLQAAAAFCLLVSALDDRPGEPSRGES